MSIKFIPGKVYLRDRRNGNVYEYEVSLAANKNIESFVGEEVEVPKKKAVAAVPPKPANKPAVPPKPAAKVEVVAPVADAPVADAPVADAPVAE